MNCLVTRIVSAGLLAGIAMSAGAAPLRLCFEDGPFPPLTMPDGSGLALDLIRTAARSAHEEVDLAALPWKRCLEEVGRGEMDGAIGAADSPERRTLGHFPLLADGRIDADAALSAEAYYVYVRNGSGSNWDGKKLTVPRGAVLIPRGYHIADTLKAQGYSVIESINSGEEGLDTLKAGLANVAILLGPTTRGLALSDQYRNAITVERIPWDKVNGYLLLSNPFYEESPARATALWNAIKATRKTDEFRALDEN